MNVNIFLFKQSKADEGKAFALEEHLGRINRYEPGCPCPWGWEMGPASGMPCVEDAPNAAAGEHSAFISLTFENSSLATLLVIHRLMLLKNIFFF